MKWIALALLILLAPSLASAAAFTSKANGNWSATGQTTWNEAGVPGAGDTVTITHAVTVDVNTTIGTAPADATTMVVTITNPGALTIGAGVTLTVRGNMFNDCGASAAPASGLNLGAGSVLEMDASQTTPTTQVYVIKGGWYGFFTFAGTSGSHAVVRSNAGGANAKFTNTLTDSGVCFAATYTDFLRIGNATNLAFTSGPRSGNFKATTSLDHCTFTACGIVKFYIYDASATVTFADNAFAASTAAYSCYLYGREAAAGSVVARNYFDKDVLVSPPAGFNFTDNVVMGKVPLSGLAAGATDLGFGSFARNLVRSNAAGAYNFDSSMTGNYLVDDSGYSNPSTANLIALEVARTWSNNVIDSTGVAIAGDFLNPTNANTSAIALTGNIFLPQSAGKTAGKFVSLYQVVTGSVVSIDHNTFASGVSSATTPETGIGVGEGDNGYTGMVSSLQSNVVWEAPLATGGYFVVRQQSAKQDLIAAAAIDYNAKWNLDDGSEGGGFHNWTTHQVTAMFSTGTPDVHAVIGSPGFIDNTRNLANFHTRYLGNAPQTAWATATVYAAGDTVSTSSAGFYGAQTINFTCVLAHTSESGHATNGQPGVAASWRTNWRLSSYDALQANPLLVASLIDWVRYGFSPTNGLLRNAGHDGATIGAMAWQNPRRKR